MTAQEQAVEQFRAFAESILCESVTVGLLPKDGGCSIQIAAGFREYTSLNRSVRRISLSLDLLSKNRSQNSGYGGLCSLSGSCDTAEWALPIVDVQAKEPVYVGKDGEFWIYSLSVSLRIMI